MAKTRAFGGESARSLGEGFNHYYFTRLYLQPRTLSSFGCRESERLGSKRNFSPRSLVTIYPGMQFVARGTNTLRHASRSQWSDYAHCLEVGLRADLLAHCQMFGKRLSSIQLVMICLSCYFPCFYNEYLRPALAVPGTKVCGTTVACNGAVRCIHCRLLQ